MKSDMPPGKIFVTTPEIDLSVRGLCLRPYPGHPHGCPNYNEKEGCPPRMPRVRDHFNFTRRMYVLVNRFDLAAHRRKLQVKHPSWSRRQLDCCLYWQGTARKQLKNLIPWFKKYYPLSDVNACPEALGVNVTKTMLNLGVVLEWPPDQWTYQVALAGTLQEQGEWPKGLIPDYRLPNEEHKQRVWGEWNG